MGVRDLAHERQAETETRSGAVVGVLGTGEQRVRSGGLEPDSGVGHDHLRLTVVDAGVHVDGPASGGVGDGVVDEGGHRAAQRGRVPGDQQRIDSVGARGVGEVDVVGGGVRGHALADRGSDDVQVDVLHAAGVAVELGGDQQVLDHVTQGAGVVDQAVQAVGE